jgi:hypothetical protein
VMHDVIFLLKVMSMWGTKYFEDTVGAECISLEGIKYLSPDKCN